jgi:hypothetical protein
MAAKFAEAGPLLLQHQRQVFLVFAPLDEAWRNMYDERTRLVLRHGIIVGGTLIAGSGIYIAFMSMAQIFEVQSVLCRQYT